MKLVLAHRPPTLSLMARSTKAAVTDLKSAFAHRLAWTKNEMKNGERESIGAGGLRFSQLTGQDCSNADRGQIWTPGQANQRCHVDNDTTPSSSWPSLPLSRIPTLAAVLFAGFSVCVSWARCEWTVEVMKMASMSIDDMTASRRNKASSPVEERKYRLVSMTPQTACPECGLIKDVKTASLELRKTDMLLKGSLPRPQWSTSWKNTVTGRGQGRFQRATRQQQK